MATIKTELTTSEFITLYGESQYVRGFSKDAVEAILTNMEELQDVGSDNDWTGFFMDAGEHEPETLVSENSDMFDELSSEIMDMVRDLDSLPSELSERIENEEELGSDELLTELKSQLEVLEGWNEGVAELIADAKGIMKLDNGSYITFSNV